MKVLRINVAITLIILFTSLLCQAQNPSPEVTLSASSLTGNPGDIITITIDEEYYGTPLDRRELTFDNQAVSWGKTHKWKATPGTHVLRLYSRWITEGFNAKGKPNKIKLQKILVLKISGWEKKSGFNHPGIYISGDELDIIKKNITDSSQHPMKSGLNSLKADLMHTSNPTESLKMHNIVDKKNWDQDGNAAWLLALKWALTGDDRYGAKAAEIYNAWANTCKKIFHEDEDVYQFLHGTNHTGQWLNGADILSHYNGGFEGWKKSDVEKFNRDYVRELLVPLALAWPGNMGSPYGTQNQPLYVAEAQIALGIYLDDKALFMMGYNHLFEKRLYKYDDLGTKPHLVHETENDYKKVFGENPVNLFELSVGRGGEYMERNRDVAHMGMCVTAIQKMAAMLQRQGYDDVYTMTFLDEKTPRFLQGIEWLCKASLEGGAPTTKIGDVTFGKGRIGNYEQVYDYYHNILEDKYPLPESFLNYVKNQRKNKAGKIYVLLYSDLHKK